MESEINRIVDILLNMNPDPIPHFILLKDFKDVTVEDSEYQYLYHQVCNHSFIKNYETTQNDRGFWAPFHGYTEGVIRKLLSFGLDKQHICLEKVANYLIKVLNYEEEWNQFEKQDNILWYPKMFVPLVSAAMLSLIDKENPVLEKPRQQWAYIAKESFVDGEYDRSRNIEAIKNCFEFSTKRPIQPFNYYSLLLLAPDDNCSYIDRDTDQALIDYCMNNAENICYVYNNKPFDMVQISVHNRDSRDFWHWIRALSIISQFHGWYTYQEKYYDWILSQSNNDGLWEFPKKFNFALSNSWRGKNKVIDSSIFVLKLLKHLKAY